jgi:L-fuculose-phosphate aldolase
LGEVDAVNKRVGRTGSIDFAADILKVGRELHRQNLLAAADGNISVRLDKTKILITPRGTAKGSLTPGELAVMDIDGRVLTGDPSSERQMHLEIYRRCPLARAVVHAHPPTAIGWTLAKPALRELPAESLPEVILAAGRIPVVPYARPGSLDMARGLAPFLPQCRALILARHGAVCWGETLDEAYRGIERIEHCARILATAVALGGFSSLPKKEVAALRALRAQIGERLL